jgi:hypothetical protein
LNFRPMKRIDSGQRKGCQPIPIVEFEGSEGRFLTPHFPSADLAQLHGFLGDPGSFGGERFFLIIILMSYHLGCFKKLLW